MTQTSFAFLAWNVAWYVRAYALGPLFLIVRRSLERSKGLKWKGGLFLRVEKQFVPSNGAIKVVICPFFCVLLCNCWARMKKGTGGFVYIVTGPRRPRWPCGFVDYRRDPVLRRWNRIGACLLIVRVSIDIIVLIFHRRLTLALEALCILVLSYTFYNKLNFHWILKRNSPYLPGKKMMCKKVIKLFWQNGFLQSVSSAAISGGGPGSVRVGSVAFFAFWPGGAAAFPLGKWVGSNRLKTAKSSSRSRKSSNVVQPPNDFL